MTRDAIKEVVYNCLNDQCFDETILIHLKSKHDDGEDELIYTELNFDSLDMIEFIMNLEYRIGNDFHFDDEFINHDITLRKIIDYIYNYLNKKS